MIQREQRYQTVILFAGLMPFTPHVGALGGENPVRVGL